MKRDKHLSKHLFKTLAGMFIMSAWFILFACQNDSNNVSVDVEKVKEQIADFRKEGEAARENSLFDKAIAIHTKELNLAESIGDTIDMARALNNIGTNYRRLGLLEDATRYHSNALLLSTNSRNQKDETVIKNRLMALNGLGNVYLALGDYDQSDSIFRQTLAGERELGSVLGQAINLANIGMGMERRGLTDSAWVYYRHSLALNRQVRSKLGEALCFSHFASLHEEEGKYEMALDEYKHAYEVLADSPDEWYKLEAGVNVAKLYIQLGDFVKARECLETEYAIATRIQSLDHRSRIYLLYYQLYEKQGNTRAALDSYIQASQLKDSLVDSKKVNQIQNMRVSLEREQMRNSLDRIKASYETEHRLLINVIIILAIVCLLAIMVYIRQRRHLHKIEKRNSNN